MWEFVDPEFKAIDMSWLGEGLRVGTLVWWRMDLTTERLPRQFLEQGG